jgi:hypothetical protein
MALRRQLERVVRTTAFACTLAVGIVAGCLWNAVEMIEEKLKPGKRAVAEKPHKPS